MGRGTDSGHAASSCLDCRAGLPRLKLCISEDGCDNGRAMEECRPLSSRRPQEGTLMLRRIIRIRLSDFLSLADVAAVEQLVASCTPEVGVVEAVPEESGFTVAVLLDVPNNDARHRSSATKILNSWSSPVSTPRGSSLHASRPARPRVCSPASLGPRPRIACRSRRRRSVRGDAHDGHRLYRRTLRGKGPPPLRVAAVSRRQLVRDPARAEPRPAGMGLLEMTFQGWAGRPADHLLASPP
jgi:hypothetical protein